MIGKSIFRTEWIKQNHFEFKSFAKYEDNYWLGLIMFSFKSYYLLPEYLFHYRILETSNSHSRNDKRHFERLRVEIEKIKYFQENGFFETYYEVIRNQFLELFYINTLHIIFCQFDYIPLELIQSMQLTVKDIFPDYLEYYKGSKTFINSVLTGWEDYKTAYLEWGIEKKEERIVQFYIAMRKALGLDL